MPLLNSFLLGADPEFGILEEGHLRQFNGRPEAFAPWGLDHSGWVIEPHPCPETSVRQLIKNLRTSFNDFATVAPAGKWRAGGWFRSPERVVSLGGHIHVDQPTCTPNQSRALDLFTQHLETLDILPTAECVGRRGSSYGQYSDIRVERGRFEYRTMPSWLFSQRVTKICLIGAKLCVVDPEGPSVTLGTQTQASIPRLRSFFERFQNRDDDVDWILASKALWNKLNVNPDRDLRDVWKVEPQKETPHWKEQKARERVQTRTTIPPWLDRVDNNHWNDNIPFQRVRTVIDGVTYFWRLNEDQIVDAGIRNILRAYVREEGGGRYNEPPTVRNGLLFQSLGVGIIE